MERLKALCKGDDADVELGILNIFRDEIDKSGEPAALKALVSLLNHFFGEIFPVENQTRSFIRNLRESKKRCLITMHMYALSLVRSELKVEISPGLKSKHAAVRENARGIRRMVSNLFYDRFFCQPEEMAERLAALSFAPGIIYYIHSMQVWLESNLKVDASLLSPLGIQNIAAATQKVLESATFISPKSIDLLMSNHRNPVIATIISTSWMDLQDSLKIRLKRIGESGTKGLTKFYRDLFSIAHGRQLEVRGTVLQDVWLKCLRLAASGSGGTSNIAMLRELLATFCRDLPFPPNIALLAGSSSEAIREFSMCVCVEYVPILARRAGASPKFLEMHDVAIAGIRDSKARVRARAIKAVEALAIHTQGFFSEEKMSLILIGLLYDKSEGVRLAAEECIFGPLRTARGVLHNVVNAAFDIELFSSGTSAVGLLEKAVAAFHRTAVENSIFSSEALTLKFVRLIRKRPRIPELLLAPEEFCVDNAGDFGFCLRRQFAYCLYDSLVLVTHSTQFADFYESAQVHNSKGIAEVSKSLSECPEPVKRSIHLLLLLFWGQITTVRYDSKLSDIARRVSGNIAQSPLPGRFSIRKLSFRILSVLYNGEDATICFHTIPDNWGKYRFAKHCGSKLTIESQYVDSLERGYEQSGDLCTLKLFLETLGIRREYKRLDNFLRKHQIPILTIEEWKAVFKHVERFSLLDASNQTYVRLSYVLLKRSYRIPTAGLESYLSLLQAIDSGGSRFGNPDKLYRNGLYDWMLVKILMFLEADYFESDKPSFKKTLSVINGFYSKVFGDGTPLLGRFRELLEMFRRQADPTGSANRVILCNIAQGLLDALPMSPSCQNGETPVTPHLQNLVRRSDPLGCQLLHEDFLRREEDLNADEPDIGTNDMPQQRDKKKRKSTGGVPKRIRVVAYKESEPFSRLVSKGSVRSAPGVLSQPQE